ncbi:MAG: hypothetical protein WBD71_12120, partial [Xanthobacteraceae bacterium]
GKVDGSNETFGVMTDCVYGGTPGVAAPTTTSCQLTTAWGFNASYEHYWTPSVHQSLFGAYYAVSYGTGTGSGNSMLCSMEGNGAGIGATAAAGAGCNNNWSTDVIGSRLQWDVTKSFYLGLEGIYDHMNSASLGLPGNSVVGSPLAFGSATNIEAHSNAWSIAARMHKDFLPCSSDRGVKSEIPGGSPPGIFLSGLEHVPQKWKPVLRKGHAKINS